MKSDIFRVLLAVVIAAVVGFGAGFYMALGMELACRQALQKCSDDIQTMENQINRCLDKGNLVSPSYVEARYGR